MGPDPNPVRPSLHNNCLSDYYAQVEIRVWLSARHPQRGGEREIDVINVGRAEGVLAVLERLDTGTCH